MKFWENACRHYELTDHLGNVLATVLDKKTGFGTHPYTENGLTYNAYKGFYANLSSVTDYYPFGMQMVGRVKQSDLSLTSRFGFNGKENDNEVYGKGNFQDYGMRMYMPVIERFNSIDPLAADYPFYTSYQFAGNTPIQAIDLDGGEPKPTVGDAMKATANAANAKLNAANTAAKLTNDVQTQVNVGLARWFVNKLTTASQMANATPEASTKPLIKMGSRGCAAPLTKEEVAENQAEIQQNNADPTAFVRKDVYDLANGDISEKTTAAANLVELGLTFTASAGRLGGGQQFVRDMGLGMNRSAVAAKTGSKIAVQFGKTENQMYHAFRHTDALGLDRSLVQSTIQSHFKTVSSQVVAGKPFNQIIEIGGQRIQYTAFKLSDGTFNIGRIHGVK